MVLRLHTVDDTHTYIGCINASLHTTDLMAQHCKYELHMTVFDSRITANLKNERR